MKLTHFLFCLFCCQWTLAQSMRAGWQVHLGGNAQDLIGDVLPTEDGGFLVAGSSLSEISGEKTDSIIGSFDIWIVKLNAAREIEWQKTIGGNDQDILKKIILCPDGGYLLAGQSKSPMSGNKTTENYGSWDFWIVRISEIGDVIWDNSFGGAGHDFLVDMILLPDGSYMIAGSTFSDSSGTKLDNKLGNSDYWVIRINETGEELWQMSLGGDSQEDLYSMNQTSDGHFILSGGSESTISGNRTQELHGSLDFWLVLIDSLGAIVWDRAYGCENQASLNTCFEMEDGGFLIAGSTNCDVGIDKAEPSYGDIALWAIKTNALGEVIWENTIGSPSYDNLADAIPSVDGGVILLGNISGPDAGFDKSEDRGTIWVVKLNEIGEMVWERSITNTSPSTGDQLIELGLDDLLVSISVKGNFILPYDKNQNSRGLEDYWLLNLSMCDDIDTSVFRDEHKLVANQDGMTYQWYTCNPSGAIVYSGETDQELDRDYIDGFFSVAISNGACTRYSSCHYCYHYFGAIDEYAYSQVLIFPNPAQNELMLEYEGEILLKIFNQLGELVLITTDHIIDISALCQGIYTLHLYSPKGELIEVQRMVKS